MNTTATQFLKLVREYVAGNVGWETVHQYAVQMEYENNTQFQLQSPHLTELHSVFLAADAKDDPQFRADREEIAALLAQMDADRNNVD